MTESFFQVFSMNVQRSLVIPAFLSVMFISTLAAQAAGCYDMVRVDGIDPVTNFFKGPVYDGALIGPSVETSSNPGMPSSRFEAISNKGVVHSFDSSGSEILSDRIQLAGTASHSLTPIDNGVYRGAAFVVVNSGDAYVVRQGRQELHVPAGNPPNGLPAGVYTAATPFSKDVMVLANDDNGLVFFNLKTKKVMFLPLSNNLGRGMVMSAPLVVGNEVFVTSTDGHIYKAKFDETMMTVTSKSNSDLGESIEAPPVLLNNGDIAVGTRSGRLVFMRKDFGVGQIAEKNIGAYIGPRGLHTHGDSLLISGQWGTKSVLGIVNSVTKATGKLNVKGPIASEVLTSQFNGKEIFIMVDELGNGYVTDTRLRLLGSFDLGENPASGPMNFGGNIKIPTVSARLANLEFQPSSRE